MLAENNVIEYAAYAENITNWMGFGRHVFDIDYLRCYISWRPTSYKQIIGIICNGSKSKINDDRLLAQYDIIRF